MHQIFQKKCYLKISKLGTKFSKILINKKIIFIFQNDLDELPPPKADLSAPPPYELATKLPTYEEVQREKTLHGEPTPGLSGASNSGPGRLPPPLAFLAIDAENPDVDAETGLLGTDFMFFTAFLGQFIYI